MTSFCTFPLFHNLVPCRRKWSEMKLLHIYNKLKWNYKPFLKKLLFLLVGDSILLDRAKIHFISPPGQTEVTTLTLVLWKTGKKLTGYLTKTLRWSFCCFDNMFMYIKITNHPILITEQKKTNKKKNQNFSKKKKS